MSPCMSRLRTHLDPGRPFAGRDPHHVRQVLAPRNRPMLHRDPFQLGKTVLRPLRRLAAHAATRRDLVQRQAARAVPAHLVGYDAGICHLARRQHPGHDRRHRPGCGQHAPPMDRPLSIRRTLRARLREPSMEPAQGTADERPRRLACDLTGSKAGLQFAVGGTALDQLRIEQRRTDFERRIHRCTRSASRSAWTASSGDMPNMRRRVGTIGRGHVARFSAYQRPARIAASLPLW